MIDRSEKWLAIQRNEGEDHYFNDRDFQIKIECIESLDPEKSRFIDDKQYNQLSSSLVQIVKDVFVKQGREAAIEQYKYYLKWFLMPSAHQLFFDDLKKTIG